VGLAGAFRPASEPGAVELVSMWTAPEHRRRGVATALVWAVLAWSAEVAATSVGLWVTRGAEAAIGFYRTLGFTPTGDFQPLPSDACKDELRMVRSGPTRGGSTVGGGSSRL